MIYHVTQLHVGTCGFILDGIDQTRNLARQVYHKLVVYTIDLEKLFEVRFLLLSHFVFESVDLLHGCFPRFILIDLILAHLWTSIRRIFLVVYHRVHELFGLLAHLLLKLLLDGSLHEVCHIVVKALYVFNRFY